MLAGEREALTERMETQERPKALDMLDPGMFVQESSQILVREVSYGNR